MHPVGGWEAAGFSVGGSNVEEIMEKRRIQYVPTVMIGMVSGWSVGQKGVRFSRQRVGGSSQAVDHSKLRGRSLV